MNEVWFAAALAACEGGGLATRTCPKFHCSPVLVGKHAKPLRLDRGRPTLPSCMNEFVGPGLVTCRTMLAGQLAANAEAACQHANIAAMGAVIREVGADETGEAFERSVDRIVPPKRPAPDKKQRARPAKKPGSTGRCWRRSRYTGKTVPKTTLHPERACNS